MAAEVGRQVGYGGTRWAKSARAPRETCPAVQTFNREECVFTIICTVSYRPFWQGLAIFVQGQKVNTLGFVGSTVT